MPILTITTAEGKRHASHDDPEDVRTSLISDLSVLTAKPKLKKHWCRVVQLQAGLRRYGLRWSGSRLR